MKTLIMLGTLTLAIVGCGQRTAAPTELRLEVLHTQSFVDEFISGREVVVSYVELPPNKRLARHWHPGEELVYVIEGTVTASFDGGPDITARQGDVVHIPFREWHSAIGGPDGARLVVFRVHTEGEPVRYMEEGSADR